MQGSSSSKPKPETGLELIGDFRLRSFLARVYGEDENDNNSFRDDGDESEMQHNNNNPTQFQQEADSSNAQNVQHITKLLAELLESEYLNLELQCDDETLLSKFVASWEKVSNVITWLEHTSPYFSESPRCGNGKSLKKYVVELYTVLVLNRIENDVREATFRLIAKEKNGTEINLSLMRSTSLAFQESQQGNWSLYEAKWHKPIIQQISQLYVKYPEKWFECESLKKLDFAISQASEHIVNYFPNDEIAKESKTTLQGLAGIQIYIKIQEMLAGKNAEVSSILSEMDKLRSIYVYQTCSDCKNLPLVGRAILQCQINEEARKIKSGVLPVVGNWFKHDRIKLLNLRISKVCRRISWYAGWDPDNSNSEYHKRFVVRIESEKLRRVLLHSMEMIQAPKIFGTKDSEVPSILSRNDDKEVAHMYETLFGSENLKDFGRSVLYYEIESLVKPILDLLESRAGQWFRTDCLVTIDYQITQICNIIALRCITCRDAFGEQEQESLKARFETFIVEKLPTLFRDENSDISSAFMTVDLKAIGRIYHICSKLTNLPQVERTVLELELETGLERILPSLQKARGKWFSEMSIAELEREAADADFRMRNRTYMHIGAQNVAHMLTKRWFRPLKEELCHQVFHMADEENSDLLTFLRHADPEETRHLYKTLYELEYFGFLGQKIHKQQVVIQREEILKVFRETEGKWFKEGWLTILDSAVTQACARLLMFDEVYGTRTSGEMKTQSFIRFIYLKLSFVELPRLLADKGSEVSCIFRRNDAEEINRMYQTCFSLEILHGVGSGILSFELKKRSEDISSLIANMTGRWFKYNCFTAIASKISQACGIIALRCAANPECSRHEEEKFKLRFGKEIVLSMSSDMEWIVSNFSYNDLREANIFYQLCRKAHNLSDVGITILALMLEKEGEQVLSELHKSNASDRLLEAVQHESRFTGVTASLTPSPAVSRSLREAEDFFRRLLNLRSKYRHKGLTYFGENEKLNAVVEESFSRVIAQTENGVSAVSELLAGFVDLFMKNFKEGDAESRIRLVAELLSASSTTARFRILAEQYLAKRLVSFWDFGIPESAKHERKLINHLSPVLGEGRIQHMLELITDFENAQPIQQDVNGPICRSEKESSNALPQSSMPLRTTVKVLKNDLWPVRGEVQINVPPPLAEALCRFEHRLGEVEVQKEIEYVYSLGRVSFETSLFAGRDNKTIEIMGSVYQASVLLLFNFLESITFAEILDTLQKKEYSQYQGYLSKAKAMISTAVSSLLTRDCQLILKKPESVKLRGSDVLRINYDFTSPTMRLQLPIVRSGHSEEEAGSSNMDQSLQLNVFVQTAIMKVMKQKREMKLDKLFEEVVKHGKNNRAALPIFKLDFTYFKGQVEKLVEQDDLKNHGGSTPRITYVL